MEPTAYQQCLQAAVAKLMAIREELFDATFQVAITGELREWSDTIEVGETYTIPKEVFKNCADTNVQLLTALLTAVEQTYDSLLNINNLNLRDILLTLPNQSMNESEQIAALEAGKNAGLPGSRVLVGCELSASGYACFLYDEY